MSTLASVLEVVVGVTVRGDAETSLSVLREERDRQPVGPIEAGQAHEFEDVVTGRIGPVHALDSEEIEPLFRPLGQDDELFAFHVTSANKSSLATNEVQVVGLLSATRKECDDIIEAWAVDNAVMSKCLSGGSHPAYTFP